MTADNNRTDELRDEWQTSPRPDRFGPDDPGFDQCMTAHNEAVAAGKFGYMDPTTGLFVMTALYLQKRAWCCNRGCRHCPFEASELD